MATYYAWSNIDYGAEHDDNKRELIITRNVVHAGAKVSPDILGFDGEDDPRWVELVEGQVVRTYPLPDELKDLNTSPQKIVSAQIRALQEGVDTGVLDQNTITNLLPLMKKESYPLEGKNEITEEGVVTPAEGSPPTATETQPQSSSGLPQ